MLAVVAHPDDESFALGAVLDRFARAGARTSVLCFTRGEASTLHGVEGALAEVRAGELQAAAGELGISDVRLLDHPDGGLSGVDAGALTAEVRSMAVDQAADGLLVFDPDGVTGHADHRRATAVAVSVGEELGIPVIGWTLPEAIARTLREELGVPFTGRDASEIDLVVPVDREGQRRAVQCHPSQAVPGSALWRRLELLGDREHLRWLVAEETGATADE